MVFRLPIFIPMPILNIRGGDPRAEEAVLFRIPRRTCEIHPLPSVCAISQGKSFEILCHGWGLNLSHGQDKHCEDGLIFLLSYHNRFACTLLIAPINLFYSQKLRSSSPCMECLSKIDTHMWSPMTELLNRNTKSSLKFKRSKKGRLAKR